MSVVGSYHGRGQKGRIMSELRDREGEIVHFPLERPLVSAKRRIECQVTHTRAMDHHIDVLYDVIESSRRGEIACDDHLQQIFEFRPFLHESRGLRLGSRGHYDHDPAFKQEINDMGTQVARPSRNENTAVCVGRGLE